MPGSEVSGVVTEVADDVHTVKVKILLEETVLMSMRRRPGAGLDADVLLYETA